MKKLISLIIAVNLFFSVFMLSGCNTTEQVQSSNPDKLSIVTTIFPYYDFVRTIAGDRADIRLLLSPGSEPHSYEPSPSDIVAIENCDIFIYNGGESDEWVESVLSSLDNKDIQILSMMDFVTPLYEQTPLHTTGDEYDEHIWTSIRNSEQLVTAITDEIIAADKKNSDYYENNEKDYIDKLKNLDNEFKETVSNAKRNSIVFGDRFPFLYFVTDYNLSYECAFPGCSSETEPSIATVSRLIDFVRDNNIPVVFYLEFSSGNIAKIISEDSDAKIMQFSSCHNVTKQEFENGATYVSLMEQNLDALKEALF